MVGRNDRARHVRVDFKVNRYGGGELTLGRMNGCGKRGFEPMRKVRSRADGTFSLRLPRPGSGRPFAVYRLGTPGMKQVSVPIIVRAAR